MEIKKQINIALTKEEIKSAIKIVAIIMNCKVLQEFKCKDSNEYKISIPPNFSDILKANLKYLDSYGLSKISWMRYDNLDVKVKQGK